MTTTVRPGLADGLVPGTEVGALTVPLTREQLVRYAGASGDFNPIHFSDHFATALGLPGVVAHGLLTMGIALRVVTDWVGDPARVRSYSARFTRPVPVPDDADGVEVRFAATVTSVEADTAVVTVEATCDGVKVLGAARAEVDLAVLPARGAAPLDLRGAPTTPGRAPGLA